MGAKNIKSFVKAADEELAVFWLGNRLPEEIGAMVFNIPFLLKT